MAVSPANRFAGGTNAVREHRSTFEVVSQWRRRCRPQDWSPQVFCVLFRRGRQNRSATETAGSERVPTCCSRRPVVASGASAWWFPRLPRSDEFGAFHSVADYSETSPTSTPPPPRLPRAHRNSTSLDRHLARRSCGGGAARSHPRLSLGGGGFAGTRHQVCDSDVGILGRLDAERHRHSPRQIEHVVR